MHRRAFLMGGASAVALAGSPITVQAQAECSRLTGRLSLSPMVGSGGKYRVERDITFIDRLDRKWEVPTGFVTDGASIPRLLWPIVGNPFDSDYVVPAVIHDRYCETRERSWFDVHSVFYEILECQKINRYRAILLFSGVLAGGPRWTSGRFICTGNGNCASGMEQRLVKYGMQPVAATDLVRFAKAQAEEGKTPDPKALARAADHVFFNANNYVYSGQFSYGNRPLQTVSEMPRPLETDLRPLLESPR